MDWLPRKLIVAVILFFNSTILVIYIILYTCKLFYITGSWLARVLEESSHACRGVSDAATGEGGGLWPLQSGGRRRRGTPQSELCVLPRCYSHPECWLPPPTGRGEEWGRRETGNNHRDRRRTVLTVGAAGAEVLNRAHRRAWRGCTSEQAGASVHHWIKLAPQGVKLLRLAPECWGFSYGGSLLSWHCWMAFHNLSIVSWHCLSGLHSHTQLQYI